MCDLQFVTGLGILFSAFVDLPKGISIYHFLFITRLAWFSSVTHLCGLTVLRTYFHRRPIEKLIRVICMVTMAIMLLTAIGVTLSFAWGDRSVSSLFDEPRPGPSTPGVYAICFLFRPKSEDWETLMWNSSAYEIIAHDSAISSMVLLLLSLISRIVKFQSSFSNYLKMARSYCSSTVIHRIRLLDSCGTDTIGLKAIWIRRVILYSQVATLLVFRLHCDLFVSSLSDVSSDSYALGLVCK